MERMRAAFLVNKGDANNAFEIRETHRPVPQAGEVLVKVEAFGLNFAEVIARQGLYPDAPPMPFIPGYDFVGRVESAGQGVDPQWVGKRVTGMSRFGSYAEYCATKAVGIVEVPDEMPVTHATAIGVQFATAYYSSCMATNLYPGDKVLVHAGAGGVGTALIQLAKWKGCTVIATAGSKEKVDKVLQLGADYGINYRKKNYPKEVKKILGNDRIDASFNAIGGKSFKRDMGLIGSGGRVVLYGAADRIGKKGGMLANIMLLSRMGRIIPLFLVGKSHSVIGVNMLKIADFQPELLSRALHELIKLYDQGIVQPQKGHHFTIDKLAEAHTALEKRQTMGKVAVSW
jgi:NADPH:quinone reductase-like Zn-dependent oxidoreductase